MNEQRYIIRLSFRSASLKSDEYWQKTSSAPKLSVRHFAPAILCLFGERPLGFGIDESSTKKRHEWESMGLVNRTAIQLVNELISNEKEMFDIRLSHEPTVHVVYLRKSEFKKTPSFFAQRSNVAKSDFMEIFDSTEFMEVRGTDGVNDFCRRVSSGYGTNKKIESGAIGAPSAGSPEEMDLNYYLEFIRLYKSRFGKEPSNIGTPRDWIRFKTHAKFSHHSISEPEDVYPYVRGGPNCTVTYTGAAMLKLTADKASKFIELFGMGTGVTSFLKGGMIWVDCDIGALDRLELV